MYVIFNKKKILKILKNLKKMNLNLEMKLKMHFHVGLAGKMEIR